MASQQNIVPFTWKAAADLSAHQYKFVKQTSTGINLCGDGEAFVGILQNKPSAAGQACTIATIGSISKCVFASTLTPGVKCAPSATGLAEAGTDGDSGCCIVIEDGGTSGIGSVLVGAGGQH